MLRNQQQKNLQDAAQLSTTQPTNLRSEQEWQRAFAAPITVTINADPYAMQTLPPNTPLPVSLRVDVKQTVYQLKEQLCAVLKAGLPP